MYVGILYLNDVFGCWIILVVIHSCFLKGLINSYRIDNVYDVFIVLKIF